MATAISPSTGQISANGLIQRLKKLATAGAIHELPLYFSICYRMTGLGNMASLLRVMLTLLGIEHRPKVADLISHDVFDAIAMRVAR